MEDRVTTGELYRVLLEIRADVKAQNSRVRKLEEDSIRIKTIWSAGTLVAVLAVDWLKHRLGF